MIDPIISTAPSPLIKDCNIQEFMPDKNGDSVYDASLIGKFNLVTNN